MTASPAPARTVSMVLNTTPEQLALLRRAAAATNRSLTGFVLEAACDAAKQAVIDQGQKISQAPSKFGRLGQTTDQI